MREANKRYPNKTPSLFQAVIRGEEGGFCLLAKEGLSDVYLTLLFLSRAVCDFPGQEVILPEIGV